MNYTHVLETLPKSVAKVTVTIPWTTIQSEYEKAFTSLQLDLEVEGFRRGKAPKSVAEKHIAKDKVYDRLVRDTLSVIYEQIIKKESLQPVVSPKIELKEAKENEQWTIVFLIAQKPQIDLGDYKKHAQKAKADLKAADIWVPGKDNAADKPDDQVESIKRQKIMNDILAQILKHAKIEVADQIIDEELDGRLTRLVDDVQKAGLTMDSYLKSKNTTMEDLRANYRSEVEETYKIEFVLSEIAEIEKIQVDPKELEKILESAKDEKEREMAAKNMYFYAMIMRKQKVLDFLFNL